MKALRVITQIDRALCRLYGLSGEHRARDFVALEASDEATGELLLRQIGHGEKAELEIGIRLPVALVNRLGAVVGTADPLPHAASIGVAAEEVSHFRYVVECARLRRAFSPFELELQGEIDRFAVLYFWALRGRRLDYPLFRDVAARCFGRFVPSRSLSAEEQARYQEAHVIAGRIVTQSLASAVYRRQDPTELVARLRRIYQASLADKVSEAA